ncbi:MAG: hypothetical protein H6605_00170 [Flavobacteriales bacterium]|nr:hypothetical protein [Flavobacteriales bacterium]
MSFLYKRIEHNTLLDLLKNEEISSALAYILDYSDHENLKVIPKEYSIEISNENITIVFVFSVGFEGQEYKEVLNKNNLHLVTFSEVVPKMIEFENLGIKYVDNISLLFLILSRTKNPLGIKLFSLKNLSDV